jgi:hypothetical protein
VTYILENIAFARKTRGDVGLFRLSTFPIPSVFPLWP